MKMTVIPRHADALGRIPVPAEFRRILNMSSTQDLQVYLSEPGYNGIITIRPEPKGERTVIQAKVGYLVLPQVYRHQYGLTNCSVDFWIAEGELKFQKTSPQCMISGSTEELIRYRETNRFIAKKVLMELVQSAEE